MAKDQSTIQSLKAVDAWIDVINANINGGVRTSFKASRLRFGGNNIQIDRSPTGSALPLQLPESGLFTANTVIDWTQGAITSSTETTHLAIQGEGFFLLASPDAIDPAMGQTVYSSNAKFLLTRDGEFHTDADGHLRTSFGYYLVTVHLAGGPSGPPLYSSGSVGGGPSAIRPVINNLDSTPTSYPTYSVALSDFIAGGDIAKEADGSPFGTKPTSLVTLTQGKQNLRYSQFGATVFDFGFTPRGATQASIASNIRVQRGTPDDAAIISKSLEASNSSMTQSVPELSLAQKLFSALTKVLQIGQTNTDSLLNLIR